MYVYVREKVILSYCNYMYSGENALSVLFSYLSYFKLAWTTLCITTYPIYFRIILCAFSRRNVLFRFWTSMDIVFVPDPFFYAFTYVIWQCKSFQTTLAIKFTVWVLKWHSYPTETDTSIQLPAPCCCLKRG